MIYCDILQYGNVEVQAYDGVCIVSSVLSCFFCPFALLGGHRISAAMGCASLGTVSLQKFHRQSIRKNAESTQALILILPNGIAFIAGRRVVQIGRGDSSSYLILSLTFGSRSLTGLVANFAWS